jgi:hypothetical protein
MPADRTDRADFFEEIGAEFSKTPRALREAAAMTARFGSAQC